MIYDLIFSFLMVSYKLNAVSRKDSVHIQQSPLEFYPLHPSKTERRFKLTSPSKPSIRNHQTLSQESILMISKIELSRTNPSSL